MRDLRRGRKLKRITKQRRALLKSLAVSLVTHGKIETTEAKAKELRPYVERLVTFAKSNALHHKRKVYGVLSKVAAEKMIKDIGLRYQKRNGGYARVIKTRFRKGDAARMAIIEFV